MVIKNSLSKVQVEQGYFKTSYIPTSGASATRAADVVRIPTSAFGYNAEGGTVVVEGYGPVGFNPVTGKNHHAVSFNSGAGGVSIRWYSITTSTEGIHDGVVVNSGSQFDPLGVQDFQAGSNFKSAIAFVEDDFAFVSPGMASVNTDSSGTLPTADNREIGSKNGDVFLNGHIKSIQYYPRRLTNAQLQELTT